MRPCRTGAEEAEQITRRRTRRRQPPDLVYYRAGAGRIHSCLGSVAQVQPFRVMARNDQGDGLSKYPQEQDPQISKSETKDRYFCSYRTGFARRPE